MNRTVGVYVTVLVEHVALDSVMAAYTSMYISYNHR